MDPFYTAFMSSYWESCQNSLCFSYDYDDPIRSQICTAVVTCIKLWHDEIVMEEQEFFTRIGLWSHILFVKWVPDSLIIRHTERVNEIHNTYGNIQVIMSSSIVYPPIMSIVVTETTKADDVIKHNSTDMRYGNLQIVVNPLSMLHDYYQQFLSYKSPIVFKNITKCTIFDNYQWMMLMVERNL